MLDFKIAAAQVPSIRGDLERNIATHVAAITAAARHEIALLVFAELSLIGYEPDLAASLAIKADDRRLTPLLSVARQHRVAVIAGAALDVGASKPALGAIVVDAAGDVRTYSKMHLGTSERSHFTPGDTPMTLAIGGHTVGVAICADASQPSHPQTYADARADIYAASVFMNAEWYETDAPRLARHAARFRMLTVMANQAASVGTYASVGKSAIWAPDGVLLAQADDTEYCLIAAARNDGKWSGAVAPLG